jgi:hypothetical protein
MLFAKWNVDHDIFVINKTLNPRRWQSQQYSSYAVTARGMITTDIHHSLETDMVQLLKGNV